MKNYKFLVVMLLAAAVFTSCGSDDTPEIPVVVTKNPDVVDLSYKGGEFEIAYSVTTGDRPYVDAACDWIQVVSSDADRAKLVVKTNEGAARSAKVTIFYYDADPVIITYNQATKPPLSERLVITAEDVTDNQIKVVCHNTEGESLWYYYIVMTKAFYDENVAPDSAAWVAGNVKQKYESWKFLYDFYNETSEVIDNFADYYLLTNAETDELLFDTNILPETDYVIVAYDLDPQARYSGEITTCAVKTKPIPEVEMIDLTFEMNITMSGDSSRPYQMTITPSLNNVRHFSYVALQEEYQAALAAFGGDIDVLAEEFRKQFLAADVLWKYVNVGTYVNTFGDIEDHDGDGRVTLVVIACGMDAYYRINSKAQVSAPFELAAVGVQGAAYASGKSRPAAVHLLERNWRNAVGLKN